MEISHHRTALLEISSVVVSSDGRVYERMEIVLTNNAGQRSNITVYSVDGPLAVDYKSPVQLPRDTDFDEVADPDDDTPDF